MKKNLRIKGSEFLILSALLFLSMACGSSDDDSAPPISNPPITTNPTTPTYPTTGGTACVVSGQTGSMDIGFSGPSVILGQFYPWLCAGQQPGNSVNCAMGNSAPLQFGPPISGGIYQGTDTMGNGVVQFNVTQANQGGQSAVAGVLSIRGTLLQSMLNTYSNGGGYYPYQYPNAYPYQQQQSSQGGCVQSMALSLDITGYPSTPRVNQGKAYLQISSPMTGMRQHVLYFGGY